MNTDALLGVSVLSMTKPKKAKKKAKWNRRLIRDIGIDLGTANTLVYVSGKGIIINEPSVVAVNTKTSQILAIGKEAREMVGKTPQHIIATRPLVGGVISDFEITEQMLRHFIRMVNPGFLRFAARPRVVVGIPSGCTAVEEKSVADAAKNAGAGKVYLIEEPMAAAIGSRLPVQDATGTMIVDIGGGTSEVAVISLGGVIIRRSIRIAGDRFNHDIVTYARTQLNLLIGERTAEQVKISIGSARPQRDRLRATLRGRDVINGLPRKVVVNDHQIRTAMSRSMTQLMNSIRSTIEETPPELVSDIMKRGIILAGGGGLIRGLAERIQEETEIKAHLTDDPLTAVARGAGILLENIDSMKDVLVPDA